jgi:alanine dehydrogenase
MTVIGLPTEIKNHEYRVALTPAGVRELVQAGHEVVVQIGAGVGAGFSDEAYEAQGASLLPNATSVFSIATTIVKVKEPQPEEVAMLRPHHVLFTYLHLAADKELTASLVATGATCIAYETVTDAQGRLPLLAPMSEIAGRVAVQAGAHYLERAQGGRGVLLGGTAGVPGAHVTVIGGGVAGEQAARIALGMGAQVTVFDRNLDRLRELDARFDGQVSTQYASALAIEESLPATDLLIGAVLIRGARSPYVLHRNDLEKLPQGAVLVDISIDQGGCFETSRPTTHADPVYLHNDIVHYCVANIPGAVPVTSTLALTNATLPYVVQVAAYGERLSEAVQQRALAGVVAGVSCYRGALTSEPVAEATGLSYTALDRLFRQ